MTMIGTDVAICIRMTGISVSNGLNRFVSPLVGAMCKPIAKEFDSGLNRKMVFYCGAREAYMSEAAPPH
jgi:hypothetical protein